MTDLKVGDRVVALTNPIVSTGYKGVVTALNERLCQCEVKFYGIGTYWMKYNYVSLDTTCQQDAEPPLPTPRVLRVGDKVRIKPRKWYEANKNLHEIVPVPFGFVSEMAELCGKVFEISEISETHCFGPKKYTLKGAERWVFSEETFDTTYAKHQKSLLSRALDPLIGSVTRRADQPSIKVNLIETNKLLTNVKLDRQ